MIGERYTLMLRHEMVDPETGTKYQLEPPLAICYTMCAPRERGGIIYTVNNMLRQMEREFLKQMDGGMNDATD